MMSPDEFDERLKRMFARKETFEKNMLERFNNGKEIDINAITTGFILAMMVEYEARIELLENEFFSKSLNDYMLN